MYSDKVTTLWDKAFNRPNPKIKDARFNPPAPKPVVKALPKPETVKT